MPPKKTVGKAINPLILKQTFYKFSDNKEIMNDGQLFEFLTEVLQIQPTDPVVGHITANIMELTKIEETRIDNFAKLFDYAKAETIPDLKQNLPTLQQQARQPHHFAAMYKKMFKIYSGDFTTLDLDTAEQLWLVYLQNHMALFKQFRAYLEQLEGKANYKVHQDLWKMVFEFATEVKDIQTQYSESDGWPVFLDSFVEFVKEKGL